MSDNNTSLISVDMNLHLLAQSQAKENNLELWYKRIDVSNAPTTDLEVQLTFDAYDMP